MPTDCRKEYKMFFAAKEQFLLRRNRCCKERMAANEGVNGGWKKDETGEAKMRQRTSLTVPNNRTCPNVWDKLLRIISFKKPCAINTYTRFLKKS